MRNFYLLMLALLFCSSCVTSTSKNKALKARVEPLPAVTFNGKAFFPLGAYDTYKIGEGGKLYSIDPDFVAAGGNFADLGQLGIEAAANYKTHSQPAIFEALEIMQSNPDYHKIAFIVGLGSSLLMDISDAEGKLGHGSMLKPLSPELREKHKVILADAVKKLAKYPNIIGYTIDEPENIIWGYYGKYHRDDWEKTKDAGLSLKMLEWLNWTKPVIQENHPGAKLFPILGWWTTYEDAGDMYDVLIANQYPGSYPGQAEFSGPFYEVSYDSAKAVAAARKNAQGKTMVYMPPMFDIISSDYANRTYNEQLYVNFAPITRGAMGIHGWRLQRCSKKHREEVIYLAMKKVSELSEFFLGEWFDEYVVSDHDDSTVDYLQKFRERVRLVTELEDGKEQNVIDFVPDVSYCLRRHQDGRYLLLAVNNRREAIDVEFTIGLGGKLGTVLENFSGKTLNWQNKKLQDHFTPFAVKAYIFEIQ